MTTSTQMKSSANTPVTSRLSDTFVEIAFTFVFLIVVAATLTGVGWVLFQVFRGLVWTFGVAASYVGAIGWIISFPLVALAIWETVSRLKPNGDGTVVDAPPGSPPAKPQRGRTRPLFCAGAAAVILSGNLCLNIAAGRIEAHYQSRKQQGVDIYKNHDLAKLVGQCVRLALLRYSGSLPKSDVRSALESIAAIAPQRWAEMTDTEGGKQPDPRVLALADAKLTQFIQEPKAEALNQAEWVLLLTDWRDEIKASALTPVALNAAAATVAKDFGVTLREALKADFEKGGKAWAAMQLDIAQQLLNRTPVSMATGNPEINAAMATVKGLLIDEAKGLPALHRTILDARQAQDEHARAVTRNFDQVAGVLDRLVIDVATIGTDVVEIKGEAHAIRREVGSVRGDTRGLVQDLESRLDPVRGFADQIGIDIDSVSASDFIVDYATWNSMIYLRIQPKGKLQELAMNGLLQCRIGEGPWEPIFKNSSIGDFALHISKQHVLEDGPVDLRFVPHDPNPKARTYGPYRFDVSFIESLRVLSNIAIQATKRWASEASWLESQPPHGWAYDLNSLHDHGRFIRLIEIGTQENKPDVTWTIPKMPPNIRISSVTGVPSPDEGELVNTGAAGMQHQEIMEPIRHELTLFGRLQFVDGTWSDWRKFEASSHAGLEGEESVPGGVGIPASPRNADVAFRVMSKPGFEPGMMGPGSVTLRQLGFARKHLSHVLLRRQAGEPAKRFEVVAVDDAGRLHGANRDQTIVYADSSGSWQYEGSIRCPIHWSSIEVEAILKDGRSIAYTLQSPVEPQHVGFVAQPIGENVESAPTIYLSWQKGGNQHSQFSIQPWFDASRGELQVASSTQCFHQDDEIVATLIAPSGQETRYTYKLQGMSSIAEYLPFDPVMVRVQPKVIFDANVPAEAVTVSADGSVFAILDKFHRVHVVERSTGVTRVSVDDLATPTLSIDGSRLMGFRHGDGVDRTRSAEGFWMLFDTGSGRKLADIKYGNGTGPGLQEAPEFHSNGQYVSFRRRFNLTDRPAGAHIFQRDAGLWNSSGVWLTETGELVLDKSQDTGYVLGTTSDGDRFVSLSLDRKVIRILPPARTQPKALMEATLPSRADAAAVAPDGSSVAIHSHEARSVTVFGLPDLNMRFTTFSEKGWEHAVPDYTRDGRSILLRPGLADREYELVDAATGASTRRIPQNDGGLVSSGVAWRGKGLGYSIRLVDLTKDKPIECTPRDPHYGYWQDSPFRGGRNSFMLGNP